MQEEQEVPVSLCRLWVSPANHCWMFHCNLINESCNKFLHQINSHQNSSYNVQKRTWKLTFWSVQMVDTYARRNDNLLCCYVFLTNCSPMSPSRLHAIYLFCLFIYLLKSFFPSMHVYTVFEMELPSCPRVNSLQH